MSSIAKQRLAVVVAAAVLLALDFSIAHLAAAVVGVVFFCWLIGAAERPGSADGCREPGPR